MSSSQGKSKSQSARSRKSAGTKGGRKQSTSGSGSKRRDELNEKQKTFIREYLVDLNGKQAAIRAGYSEKTAEFQASRLLSKAKVDAAVKDALSKRMKKLDISAERVLQEIACMSFYDPSDFESVKGPEDIKNLPEHVRRAIVGWDWNRNGKFVLKISPKTPSLDQLGRYLRMFTEKIEISGRLSIEDLICGDD